MKGLFITFEGTEGSGKSTQIALLADRLKHLGHTVRTLREPGGTPLSEEIRHLLKHAESGRAMQPETELLLMNASRAQLVREAIRPALAAGEIVLCDRFYDSTIAYQGHGRQLDLAMVQAVIAVAVGDTRPDLTLLLMISPETSEARRAGRQARLFEEPAVATRRPGAVPLRFAAQPRDRFEEADREFFRRVETGFRTLAAAEPQRVRCLDAAGSIETVRESVWQAVEPGLEAWRKAGTGRTGEPS